MTTPVWLHEVNADYACDGCDADITDGHPAAWQADGGDGSLLCLDCGSTAEDQAEAVSL